MRRRGGGLTGWQIEQGEGRRKWFRCKRNALFGDGNELVTGWVVVEREVRQARVSVVC